jgi:hypothetical protein
LNCNDNRINPAENTVKYTKKLAGKLAGRKYRYYVCFRFEYPKKTENPILVEKIIRVNH